MFAGLFPYCALGLFAGPLLYVFGAPVLGASISLLAYPGFVILVIADIVGSPLMRQ